MESPVSARAALLQVLVDGPGFDLDLIERVRAKTGGAVQLLEGSVYPALRSLRLGGLAEVRDGDTTDRGGRPKRFYTLTHAGREQAERDRQTMAALCRPGG